MLLKLENKDYVDIKISERRVLLETGTFIKGTDDEHISLVENSLNFESLENILKLLGVKNLRFCEDIKDYLIENREFLRITKLNDSIQYSFISYYTDEVIFSSQKFDDLINVAICKIYNRNINIY